MSLARSSTVTGQIDGMWLPRDGVEGGTVPFEVVESCPHLPPRELLYTSTPVAAGPGKVGV